ncbi:unnamed protein product [Symbiodinium sp. CCMP2456]|nr:unnamed protein product [Symbiodinium sp. CCMP2456]
MSLYRPSSAGYEGSVFLTTMSQNKQAPKWSFAGRYGANTRLLTPGPGTYGADSRSQRPAGYGFGSCARDQGPLSMASPGPGAYGVSECYGSAAAPTELIADGLGMVVELQAAVPATHLHSSPGWVGGAVAVGAPRQVPGLTATFAATPKAPGRKKVALRVDTGTLARFGTSNRGIRANGQNPGPGQYDLRAWVAKPPRFIGRA